MNSSMTRKIIVIVLAASLILGTITAFKIYATDGKSNISGNFASEPQKAASSDKQIDYEGLFEKDNVKDIYIEISEDNWQSILADPLAEEYKSATITVDGITLENVGFRTKGNSSLRSVANSDSIRYSFRVKLDKYEDQYLLGLDEFVLNNMYSDPSYMREYLSYEALREIGAVVPMTSFANVYINGELFGFYLMVEAIDDSFIERNFADADGNLYKQEQGSTLQYVEGSSYEKSQQKSGDDESKADLKEFIEVLNEMPDGEKGDIERVLDVDSALRYIAANTVLGNYDSYNGSMAQNYYLYSQDGRFTVIPWDYNESFGGFGQGADLTAIPIDEPVLGADIENLPLIDDLLEVEEYREKYYDYIRELLDYLENFETRVAQLASIIRPYVNADPTKFYTMEQFEASISYSEDMENSVIKDLESENPPQNDLLPPKRPQQMQHENMPMPQDRPQPPSGGDMKGGPGMGGRGIIGGSTSILDFVRDRVENIKQQLAGQ